MRGYLRSALCYEYFNFHCYIYIEGAAITYQNVIIFHDACSSLGWAELLLSSLILSSKLILSENISYWDTNGSLLPLVLVFKMATPNKLFWIVLQRQLGVARL